MNSHVTPHQRAILVFNELLAPWFSSFQSHRTVQVLVGSPLVAIPYESFCFGEVLFGVRLQPCSNHLLQVCIRRLQ